MLVGLPFSVELALDSVVGPSPRNQYKSLPIPCLPTRGFCRLSVLVECLAFRFSVLVVSGLISQTDQAHLVKTHYIQAKDQTLPTAGKESLFR